MLFLTSCVLLATSALAMDYRPSTSAYPIDQDDDFRIKPGQTNLIYNFEQLRRDQPPQIESRDENLYKYMYRPKPMPTSTPIVPVSLYNNYAVDLPDSDRIHPEARYPDRDRDVTSTPMPPPPPAPAPKWLDLSSDFYKTQYQPQYYPVDTYQARPTTTSTTTPVPYVEESPRWPGTVQQPYSGYQRQPSVPQYSDYQGYQQKETTVQPHWTELAAASDVNYSMQQPNVGVSRSRGAGRGSHKFDWSDVVPTKPTYQAIPTTAAPKVKGPPPALPTLTPWSGDNFGK